MDNYKNINISAITILKVALVALAFYAIFVLKDIVLVVLTAITIASSIEPITKKIIAYRIPRTLAVVLIYIAIALILLGIFYFFLPGLLNDVSTLLNSLPKYISTFDLWNPFKDTQVWDQASNISRSLSLTDLTASISNFISNLTSNMFSAISDVFGGLLSFILIIVLSFYFSVQEDGVGNFLRIVTPLKYEKYIIGLWRRAQNKIGLWMQGQILLGVIIGVLTYLGLSILGVRSAMFLALIAMIFELIPVFGVILATIPALAIAFTDGGATLGLFTLGLYIIIHQFE
ncbi:AI-2E family transporter, partial [Candidatus Nomurabacteria bacterium]|nr:AI-2E family transporter [Candidatus Nomurabacteria bacterium]